METGGRSSLRFLTGGVQCDIVLPGASLIRVVSSSPVDVGSASASVAEAKATTPSVPRILVVEDTSLIVMLIEQLFSDLGWTMIGPATRLAEAVALAERETFDAAIVDINLAGEMSWDVADVLQRRNIPLMFSTGYDSATILPPSLSHMPIISKPFLLADLERRLRQLISSRPSSPLPNAISDLS